MASSKWFEYLPVLHPQVLLLLYYTRISTCMSNRTDKAMVTVEINEILEDFYTAKFEDDEDAAVLKLLTIRDRMLAVQQDMHLAQAETLAATESLAAAQESEDHHSPTGGIHCAAAGRAAEPAAQGTAKRAALELGCGVS